MVVGRVCLLAAAVVCLVSGAHIRNPRSLTNGKVRVFGGLGGGEGFGFGGGSGGGGGGYGGGGGGGGSEDEEYDIDGDDNSGMDGDGADLGGDDSDTDPDGDDATDEQGGDEDGDDIGGEAGGDETGEEPDGNEEGTVDGEDSGGSGVICGAGNVEIDGNESGRSEGDFIVCPCKSHIQRRSVDKRDSEGPPPNSMWLSGNGKNSAKRNMARHHQPMTKYYYYFAGDSSGSREFYQSDDTHGVPPIPLLFLQFNPEHIWRMAPLIPTMKNFQSISPRFKRDVDETMESSDGAILGDGMDEYPGDVDTISEYEDYGDELIPTRKRRNAEESEEDEGKPEETGSAAEGEKQEGTGEEIEEGRNGVEEAGETEINGGEEGTGEETGEEINEDRETGDESDAVGKNPEEVESELTAGTDEQEEGGEDGKETGEEEQEVEQEADVENSDSEMSSTGEMLDGGEYSKGIEDGQAEEMGEGPEKAEEELTDAEEIVESEGDLDEGAGMGENQEEMEGLDPERGAGSSTNVKNQEMRDARSIELIGQTDLRLSGAEGAQLEASPRSLGSLVGSLLDSPLLDAHITAG